VESYQSPAPGVKPAPSRRCGWSMPALVSVNGRRSGQAGPLRQQRQSASFRLSNSSSSPDEPGELFGETAIFDGDERDDHVEAVAPSTVVMIPAEEMRHLMAEGADVALNVTKMVGLRRHRIQRRLGSLLFLSYRERLVQLLLDLADQFGCRRDEEDGIRLRIKLSHRELAHLIGSTRETVAVLLGQLKAEGSVDGGRRSVVLTNPQRLVRV